MSRVRPVVTRTRYTLQSLSLATQQVLPYKAQSLFSWEILKPEVDTTLAGRENNIKQWAAALFYDYV